MKNILILILSSTLLFGCGQINNNKSNLQQISEAKLYYNGNIIILQEQDK